MLLVSQAHYFSVLSSLGVSLSLCLTASTVLLSHCLTVSLLHCLCLTGSLSLCLLSDSASQHLSSPVPSCRSPRKWTETLSDEGSCRRKRPIQRRSWPTRYCCCFILLFSYCCWLTLLAHSAGSYCWLILLPHSAAASSVKHN